MLSMNNYRHWLINLLLFELSEAQLQAEVNDIKKSLEMCCGGGSLIDDEGHKSYLLQNTPNPFYENTNIQYFIPSDATIANLTN